MNYYDLRENWDDMTVALLGYRQTVLGFDAAEVDYFKMINLHSENLAVAEAEKRLFRLKKPDLIHLFRTVLATLVLFLDRKSAHDCLTASVKELDSHAAMMENSAQKGTTSQRMWIE